MTLRDPTFCADAGGNAARPPFSGRRRRGPPAPKSAVDPFGEDLKGFFIF